jgi:D-glycero-D-manno-heptose 1,7-bisphosphate phosphatase
MSLLLIDMDGTLREPLSGQQYFQHPKDQRIIEGADIAIRAYKDDWIIAGITNQGGVGAGHKSMQEGSIPILKIDGQQVKSRE